MKSKKAEDAKPDVAATQDERSRLPRPVRPQ
jgi:hypothetical protein